jgi:hypothetical protein
VICNWGLVGGAAQVVIVKKHTVKRHKGTDVEADVRRMRKGADMLAKVPQDVMVQVSRY